MAINKNIIEQRKNLNLCIQCGLPTINNKIKCQKHLNEDKIRRKRYYDRHKQMGRCVKCGVNNSENGFSICRICREKRKAGRIEEYSNSKKYRQDIKKKCMDRYGGECGCCGENRLSFLAIDHTNGCGNIHRKQINRRGTAFYKWLIGNNFPDGFRVLCYNCNMSIYLNNGICEHKFIDQT